MPDPASATPTSTPRGLTVADLVRRYRVSAEKVRAWIRRRELRAINTSDATCAKPRFVVPPEALAEFEAGRDAAPPPQAAAAPPPPAGRLG
jgi:hypothetical protein